MSTLPSAPVASSAAAVRLEGVTRRYPNGVEALEDVSLDIAPGSFVSLLGPSGCGKSTLLSLLAGLDAPSEGRVVVGGRVGVVFQEAALFPWRTVRDNVAFGLEMQGVAKAERRARAEALLRRVHLSRFAGAFPHELSGGMRQRAAIARALATEPDILLMDEPFGALDAQTRALLQAELLSLWEGSEQTVVFVTHSLDEALRLSDRVVLLSARPGRVIGDFPVRAPRPRSPQTDASLAVLRGELDALLAREVRSVSEAEWGGNE
jgi:ABC-type nitrate/sulfonate/bicarbonate transport system, ATPase component